MSCWIRNFSISTSKSTSTSHLLKKWQKILKERKKDSQKFYPPKLFVYLVDLNIPNLCFAKKPGYTIFVLTNKDFFRRISYFLRRIFFLGRISYFMEELVVCLDKKLLIWTNTNFDLFWRIKIFFFKQVSHLFWWIIYLFGQIKICLDKKGFVRMASLFVLMNKLIVFHENSSLTSNLDYLICNDADKKRRGVVCD